MRSIAQRSIMIDGHKTSVSVEDAFWTELKQIAHLRRVTVASLVGAIDAARKQSNLSSAIRIFVLEHLQNKDKPGVPLESSPVTAGSNE